MTSINIFGGTTNKLLERDPGISMTDMSARYLIKDGYDVQNRGEVNILGTETNIVKCISIIEVSRTHSMRGHIPDLFSSSTIFKTSTNSLNLTYPTINAFNNNNSNRWVSSSVATTTTPVWIQIELPTPIAVFAVSLRGLVTTPATDDGIKVWNFEGYDETNSDWNPLYQSIHDVITGDQLYSFYVPVVANPNSSQLQPPTIKTYSKYRIIIYSSTTTTFKPALSRFQIYSYLTK